ncbi:hypothetical protein QJS66_06170 [Kocuria rhizophila]|nr:hypothetical protein QJS66_06170 [Kocuria rhizophila]
MAKRLEARRRDLLHRVQLRRSCRTGLPQPLPAVRLHLQTGGSTSGRHLTVGNGPRAQGRRGRRCTPSAPIDRQLDGTSWQVGGRRHLAEPGADLALRLLPVLAQHR